MSQPDLMQRAGAARKPLADRRAQVELLGETRLASFFSPLLARRWLWLEAVLVPVLALALCWLISPEDPFFVKRGEFPWPWFAPVLVALRYGVMAGIASSAVLIASWFVLAVPGVAFPTLNFVAGVILVLICGEYSTTWRMRLRRVGELNAYVSDRLTRMTNQLNVLHISHETLENDLVGQPGMLRDALYELRKLMSTRVAAAGESGLPVAEEVLALLAHHCQLGAVALYELDGGRYVARAKRGNPPPIGANDTLLAYAVEKRKLAHLRTADLGPEPRTKHLAVAPILTSGGQLLGVLVVTRMRASTSNEDTLRTLALLLGVYADSAVVSREMGEVMSQVPGVTFEFAEELAKLMRLQREYRITSHCVILQFGAHPERVDMMLFTLRLRRRFDVQWQFGGRDGRPGGIANLMPLATETSVRGYLERMEASLQERFGADFETLHIRPYVVSLEQHEPLEVLGRIVTSETAT